jgi:hypothetical protein
VATLRKNTDRHFAFLSSSIFYTFGILPLARRMEQHGYQVHWISFRGYERHWLMQQGVPPERILDTVGTFDPSRYGEEEITERLTRLEGDTAPRVNDIILMDRKLKLKPKPFSRAYMAHIERVLTEFLIDRQIQFVSAGRDTALQISCGKICARLGIPSVVPTVARMPDDRYGFCLGHTEWEFVKFRDATEADRVKARAFVQEFRETKPVPSAVLYERRNSRFLRRLHTDFANWIRMAYHGLYDRGNDYTRYSTMRLLYMFWRKRLNALIVNLFPVYEPLGTRPFVLYAVMMQPESSIDVLASFVSDQKTLITQIARSTPATHDVCIKAHPDYVGGMSRGQLLELRKIPGTRLIFPDRKTHDLMKKAAVVITPTGTMAFEAALHGIPSIIFAPEFFRKVPGVHYCSTPTALPDLLQRLLTEPRRQHDDAIVEFLASIFANTFVGRVTTYMGDFTEDELRDLHESYDRVFERLVEAPAAALVPQPL